MLAQATGALAALDAARLEEILSHLQAMLEENAQVMSTPEITARMRVFAGVVRASGENLTILERVEKGQTWVR